MNAEIAPNNDEPHGLLPTLSLEATKTTGSKAHTLLKLATPTPWPLAILFLMADMCTNEADPLPHAMWPTPWHAK